MSNDETKMILDAIARIEKKLVGWREALLTCRREARFELMDRHLILKTVNDALGEETGPENSREEMSPVLNGTLDAAAARLAGAIPHEDWHPLIAPGVVMAIGMAIDQNGTTRPGDKLVQIGKIVDDWKGWLPVGPQCEDCGRPYSDPGFCDLVVPNAVFAQISDSGDENGLFCPSCLLARLARKGIACEGALRSGPVATDHAGLELAGVALRASRVFRDYARLHRAKGTEEGVAKAEMNEAEAEKLEGALERWTSRI